METIIIIVLSLAVIFLSITLITYFKKVKKLEDGINDLAIAQAVLSENRLELFLITKKLTKIIMAHTSTISRNVFPFKVLDENTEIPLDITAIRFKKTELEILIYINGTMKPFNGKVKLNHPDWATKEKREEIWKLLNILNSSSLTGENNTKELKQININLNK